MRAERHKLATPFGMGMSQFKQENMLIECVINMRISAHFSKDNKKSN